MKGMSPKISKEWERIHREYFGGTHQILLLMDSVEGEETFYTYKDGLLVSKEGFYIYYHSKTDSIQKKESEFEVIDLNIEAEEEQFEYARGGRYRELLQTQQAEEKGGSNIGLAVAVALLVFVIGIGAYENRESIFGGKEVRKVEEAGYVSSESEKESMTETTASEAAATEATTEIIKEDTTTENTIPVEIIPGEEEKSSE